MRRLAQVSSIDAARPQLLEQLVRHRRHPPEDFEDEPTVVEDRPRETMLKLVKWLGTERAQKSRFVPDGGRLTTS